MKDLIYSIIIGILVVGIFCLANYTKDCPEVERPKINNEIITTKCNLDCKQIVKDPNALYRKYRLKKDLRDGDITYNEGSLCGLETFDTHYFISCPYENFFFDNPEDLKIINEYFEPVYE